MGCGSSKEKVCRNCRSAYSSPVRRGPSQKTGDSYHVVALTSSTLDSLKLDPMMQVIEEKGNYNVIEEKALIGNEENVAKEEIPMGLIEAKTWSKMINEKNPKIIPKTPSRTPPGEPEVINAWEMMEGLEEISHLSNSSLSSIDEEHRVNEDSDSNFNSNGTSIVSEFDHEVSSMFKRSFEELPRADPFYLEPLDGEKCASKVTNEENVNGTVMGNKIAPRGVDKLIVYFTSLRGVRKTFEDCCHVRVILKGLRIKVDERDVSMHSGFKEELKELLGESAICLPIVFLGRKCIGGAEEIRRLNEDGKLEKVVANCERVDGGGGNGEVCEACGDIRFVPYVLIAMKMGLYVVQFVVTN
ncbi:hypothetical protein BUALT_Bualt16G0008500 [Buddleja alternifolia]|uniref:Glutaredoxin domain-containing protein n=1 Tax=Buddleja alternifolia TaxID=168488 RepID=A0AAV6W9K1_9LAMI|nr:hypothetical protein BUALT_Bualt16G0008500 [Buddleja alternifolia]